MSTLATPANMRAFEEANPGRELDDGGYVEPRRCFAFSPLTSEEYSASAGDYFMQADDEPVRDSEGEPMVLAVKVVRYLDALTGRAT